MNQKIIAVFIFWFFSCPYVVGQHKGENEKDSAKIYREIEVISKKNKYFRFIHSLIFKPVSPVPKQQKKNKKKTDKNYKLSENKIIRTINITTLDPFRLDINDTTVKPTQWLPKLGNKLHIKTQNLTIKNLLLIKTGEPFDSLKAKESERLIRRQNFIKDVNFVVRLTTTKPDSVDIDVIVQDTWSIDVNVSISTLNVRDRNFAGLGYQLQHAISRYPDNNYAFETNYLINNVRNTFINSAFRYKVDVDDSYLIGFHAERPFFSSFARWGGGASFEQQYLADSILFQENQRRYQNIKLNRQDYWMGKAWPLNFDNSDFSRTSNFIIAGRFFNEHYIQRPEEGYVENYEFTDEKLFLLSAGFNTRIYLQDRYLFNYGFAEDVPTGKLFNITTGLELKHKEHRWYTGFNVGFGDYFNWGYFSNFFEFGTFVNSKKPEQGVLRNETTYFTNLLSLGRWNFRQFVKPSIVLGLYRKQSDRIFMTADSSSISSHFDQRQLEWSGNHRLSISLQTQAYAPWNFYGFRFGPFFSFSLALLSKESFAFNTSKLLTQFSIGILVKNEFLLINYFQLSFSFNPVMPGGRNNVLRVNAYETFDFLLRGFEIGKPSTVLYR